MDVQAGHGQMSHTGFQSTVLASLVVVSDKLLHGTMLGGDVGQLVAEDVGLQAFQEDCCGERIELERVPDIGEKKICPG